LGNKADVDDADILGYLGDDPETKVIAMHIEGVKEGRRFLDVAREVSPRKPIIAYKTGKTDKGATAAASHTGTMTGDDNVYDAAFKQSGIIRADDLEDLLDFAKAFTYLNPPREKRVGIVALSGGSGVMGADACEKYGLELAEISEEAERKLREIHPGLKISNPFDMGVKSAQQYMYLHDSNRGYRVPIEAFMDDENVDCMALFLILFHYTEIWTPNPNIFADIAARHREKPMVIWFSGAEDLFRAQAKIVEQLGIPAYPSAERAIKALSALYRYGEYLRRPHLAILR
jgi:acyl-CoA synthetase (NDP forming)